MTVLATTNCLFLLFKTDIHRTVNKCMLTLRVLRENYLKLTFYWKTFYNIWKYWMNACVCHLSRLSLWASILQSLPLVCGASRLPHSFCLMDSGMRNAFGPTKVVMLLAGSIRDVSMHWTSWRDTSGYCSARALDVKGAVQGWRQGAGSFLLVTSAALFPHLINLPLLTWRTQGSNECVMAERTTATVALSDCRLLYLLTAVYRKQNDWCTKTAVVPLLFLRLLAGWWWTTFCVAFVKNEGANWVTVNHLIKITLKAKRPFGKQ